MPLSLSTFRVVVPLSNVDTEEGGRGRVGRGRYQSLPYSPANKQARVTRIQPGRMLQAVSPRARYASVRRSVYLLAFLAFESGSFPSRAKDGLIRRRRRSSASVGPSQSGSLVKVAELGHWFFCAFGFLYAARSVTQSGKLAN